VTLVIIINRRFFLGLKLSGDEYLLILILIIILERIISLSTDISIISSKL